MERVLPVSVSSAAHPRCGPVSEVLVPVDLEGWVVTLWRWRPLLDMSLAGSMYTSSSPVLSTPLCQYLPHTSEKAANTPGGWLILTPMALSISVECTVWSVLFSVVRHTPKQAPATGQCLHTNTTTHKLKIHQWPSFGLATK